MLNYYRAFNRSVELALWRSVPETSPPLLFFLFPVARKYDDMALITSLQLALFTLDLAGQWTKPIRKQMSQFDPDNLRHSLLCFAQYCLNQDYRTVLSHYWSYWSTSYEHCAYHRTCMRTEAAPGNPLGFSKTSTTQNVFFPRNILYK